MVRPLNLARLDPCLERYRRVLTELAGKHFPIYFYATDRSGVTVHGAVVVEDIDGTAKVSRA